MCKILTVHQEQKKKYSRESLYKQLGQCNGRSTNVHCSKDWLLARLINWAFPSFFFIFERSQYLCHFPPPPCSESRTCERCRSNRRLPHLVRCLSVVSSLFFLRGRCCGVVGLTRESLGTNELSHPKNAHGTDGSRRVSALPRSRTGMVWMSMWLDERVCFAA